MIFVFFGFFFSFSIVLARCASSLAPCDTCLDSTFRAEVVRDVWLRHDEGSPGKIGDTTGIFSPLYYFHFYVGWPMNIANAFVLCPLEMSIRKGINPQLTFHLNIRKTMKIAFVRLRFISILTSINWTTIWHDNNDGRYYTSAVINKFSANQLITPTKHTVINYYNHSRHLFIKLSTSIYFYSNWRHNIAICVTNDKVIIRNHWSQDAWRIYI